MLHLHFFGYFDDVPGTITQFPITIPSIESPHLWIPDNIWVYWVPLHSLTAIPCLMCICTSHHILAISHELWCCLLLRYACSKALLLRCPTIPGFILFHSSVLSSLPTFSDHFPISPFPSTSHLPLTSMDPRWFLPLTRSGLQCLWTAPFPPIILVDL